MTISGCTFHENSASTLGGAIFRNNGTVTLTGNVFWGNTAGQHNVVYVSPYFVTSISSVGSNVSDKANGTDATSGSGFTFTNGDIQLTGVTFDAAFRPSHASLPVIAPLPADFPTTYFDGTSRGTTPGAMPAQ
jgi:hypothetical protein